MIDSSIFKAYDIRGTYPDQINEEAAKRIAGAYAHLLKPTKVAVGHDVRLSSPALSNAVIESLTKAGVDVVDIGAGPTELIYFAVGSLGLDGGIQVSASHNPAEYNGLKMVKKGVAAISSDTGLNEIRDLALGTADFSAATVGTVEQQDLSEDYLKFINQIVPLKNLKSLKIVANNNFGLSGPLAKQLLEHQQLSQVELVELNFQPDGHFPKGRPDPLIPENRAETSALINKETADLGVAWDADGDRCYIADEQGEFIEGCHLTALLAEHLLKKNPPRPGSGQAGEKILYDPRNIWAVEETVKAAGGTPLMNKAGHTFIKNRMKEETALFAGEMSGHFYFRDFFFADNGLLPFLLFLDILSQNPTKTVSQLMAPLRQKYFVSGEINFRVRDVSEAIKAIEQQFSDGQIDRTDGLSVTFDSWRFNLRASNTEPLLRLNVEAKDGDTVLAKTNLLTEAIRYHVA